MPDIQPTADQSDTEWCVSRLHGLRGARMHQSLVSGEEEEEEEETTSGRPPSPGVRFARLPFFSFLDSRFRFAFDFFFLSFEVLLDSRDLRRFFFFFFIPHPGC